MGYQRRVHGGTQSAHEAMARGPKKHLKRLNAPKHWMLDKMGGVWAPRPSTGPHKLRECLPLILILRNRLKYALTKKEVQQILMQRLIKVDGKVRTDPNYPCGFMDVISIDKTDEHFRMLYDAKGRFVVHRLNHKNFSKEKDYKLCRVQKLAWGAKSVPYIATHDGRTIRYPDPNTKVHDTVKVHIKDTKQRSFATRISNVFCIAAKDDTEMVSLPRGKGLRDNILEERKKRLGY